MDIIGGYWRVCTRSLIFSLSLSLSLSFIAFNFIKRIMDTFVIRDEATPRHALARLPTAEAGKDAHAGEMNVIV